MEPIDLNSLSLCDVKDEYLKLFNRYQLSHKASDADAQLIHNLKRNLELAEKTQAYLTQELDQYTSSAFQGREIEKVQAELEELQSKHTLLRSEYNALQDDYESILDDNAALRKELKEAKGNKEESKTPAAAFDTEYYTERIELVETEKLELLQKIEEIKDSGVSMAVAMAEKEKNIEILGDQVKCLEENMRFKRDELEQMVQQLESTQEQLAEANSKVAMLTSAPDNTERKGNSLFAEVDDQRQAMKQLLAMQKKNYLEMKKVYNESEYEIRRLKRENAAMHTELQTCITIFCNADRFYEKKLRERIHQLLNQIESLESKLQWTQNCLKGLADEKEVLWLESMLDFCKKETDDLKVQLHSERMHMTSLEAELRNTQQDLARWRFESLKSRCILFDRESLLNENKISFKPVTAVEFRVTEKQLETARPSILQPLSPKQTFQSLSEQVPTRIDSPNKLKSLEEEIGAIKLENDREIDAKILPETINPISTIVVQSEDESTANKENDHNTLTIKDDALTQSATNMAHFKALPLKELSYQTYSNVETHSLNKEFKKSPLGSDLCPGPSILCKERDMFPKLERKNVKFSTDEPTVHNISSNSNTSLAFEGSDAMPIQSRTKSVVVRRVVIGKKPKPK